jgi:uncharacterized protein (TIGR03086 family)
MDELVGLFLLAQREFGARVEEVGPDQWRSPTVDTEWDVGSLVDHVLEENRWVGPLVSGQSLAQAEGAVAAAAAHENDRKTAWANAAASAAQAFSGAGALDGTVDLSRGSTPVRSYITEMIFDHTIHAWDLGRAIGSERILPAELVTVVYTELEPLGDLSAAFGDMFAPPVSVSDDAPLVDKLIALTGRDPR